MNSRFRLLAALGIALVLSTVMVYTALADSDVQEPVIEIGELQKKRAIAEKQTVELVGVAGGPIKGELGRTIRFRVTDRGGAHAIPVTYSGSVPDAFRVGRQIVMKGSLKGDRFVAVDDTLVTKCPSKFQSESGSSRSSA